MASSLRVAAIAVAAHFATVMAPLSMGQTSSEMNYCKVECEKACRTMGFGDACSQLWPGDFCTAPCEACFTVCSALSFTCNFPTSTCDDLIGDFKAVCDSNVGSCWADCDRSGHSSDVCGPLCQESAENCKGLIDSLASSCSSSSPCDTEEAAEKGICAETCKRRFKAL